MPKFYVGLILIFTSFFATAMPKITVTHQRTPDNYAQAKVTNETGLELLCYVAIDGYKIKFILAPNQESQWYKATDTRFNHENFSVWCDYLSLHKDR